MKIEELKRKHFEIDSFHYLTDHSKLSIQFAIELLEEVKSKQIGLLQTLFIEDKIEELKSELNGNTK